MTVYLKTDALIDSCGYDGVTIKKSGQNLACGEFENNAFLFIFLVFALTIPLTQDNASPDKHHIHKYALTPRKHRWMTCR